MKTLRFALKQIVPVLLSYVFIGLAAGILLRRAGYAVWWATLSAVFIYAGSMQIVLVSLLRADAPLYLIALTTLFLNGRHIFYGVAFLDRFRRAGWKTLYMVLTTTDETYSILCAVRYPEEVDGRRADFLILLSCHLCWILSCTAGAFLGQALPFDMAGIEFSATAFFTAVAADQWRRFPSRLPAVTGFLCALAFYFLLGPENFILPALAAGMLVLMALRDRVERRLAKEGAAP
jgi:4-azaleucine resistance transporter AzlC